ncbi:beta-crystallin A1-like isoform X1 [Pungitius pungitius]|uniref:beta-crystallin A1-like isoform X1 n=1 Tax=Pungitius pungitius TaxID=134920 RepID=UPI002E0E176A
MMVIWPQRAEWKLLCEVFILFLSLSLMHVSPCMTHWRSPSHMTIPHSDDNGVEPPALQQQRDKQGPKYSITVYDQEHFQGRRMEFTASCQNIMECGMENIRSLKIECGAWVGYEHSSFCGQQFVLEKGDYPRFEAYSGSNSYRIERMISFRPICCANHKESRMTIFEMENMTGRQFDLCDDYPSLQAMGWMNNEVGSMHIKSGAFVCYQYPGYRGYQYIMECDCRGGEYKCYREFGSHSQTPQIQSIRRIQH